jgi:hypothetical protein
MRWSLKALTAFAEAKNLNVYKKQCLGDRKDYYYNYYLIDKDGNTVKESESIKELINYLMED